MENSTLQVYIFQLITILCVHYQADAEVEYRLSIGGPLFKKTSFFNVPLN